MKVALKAVVYQLVRGWGRKWEGDAGARNRVDKEFREIFYFCEIAANFRFREIFFPTSHT
jgi:hypothetical protein